MADVRTPELVINKLSKQQYENIQNPSDTEIYLVPEDEEHKPICYPTTASDVKTTSMIVKSSVSDNGKILTENGFVYNTSGNPTVADNKVICDLGVGFMEKVLENLTQNTEYHIKSYGQNSSGLVYGSELVQMTLNNPIPVEYQLVEYLESSGTQYIITEHKPTSLTEIQTKIFYLNSQQTGAYFGCQTSSNTQAYKGYFYNTTNYRLGSDTISASSLNGVILDVFMNQHNVIINTSTTPFPYTITNPPVGNLKLYIFANNNNGSATNLGSGRIYYFKIISDNEVVVNFYPVYRKSDNKPGMYDIVNGVFYTNQGTGEFIVGPDKEWDE